MFAPQLSITHENSPEFTTIAGIKQMKRNGMKLFRENLRLKEQILEIRNTKSRRTDTTETNKKI